MKAILLARVSSKEQEEGQSIPAQVRRLTEYAEKKKFEIAHIFETVESSTKGTRRQFNEIINIIKKAKEPYALITDTIDRLQRSFNEMPVLNDLIEKDLVELHFYRESLIINKNSEGFAVSQWEMGVVFAGSYVRQLRANVKRSIEQCTLNGQWTSKAPFGYKNMRGSGGKALIEKDPVNAPFVEKIFQLYASGTNSLRTIADEMNQLGMKSDSGGKIYHAKIESILKNPFYYGYMKVKGEIRKHNYQPLISEMLFNKVQEIIMGHDKAPVKYAGRQFIFSGLIKCKNCGCSVSGEVKKNKYIYYSCSNAKGICKKIYVSERDLLDQVLKNLESIQLTDKMIADGVAHIKKVFANEQAFTNHSHQILQQELNQVQTRISKLVDKHIDGEIDNDTYQLKFNEYKSRQREISVEMQAHVDADESCIITVKTVLELSKRAKELFLSSNVEEKQQLLKFVHSNFFLDSGKLEWELAEPFSIFAKMRGCIEWCTIQDYLRTFIIIPFMPERIESVIGYSNCVLN